MNKSILFYIIILAFSLVQGQLTPSPYQIYSLSPIKDCKRIKDSSIKDGEYYQCSYECLNGVKKTKDQCQIADVGCKKGEKFDRFNFFSTLYCSLDGNIYVFVPIAIIIIYLILSFISATVDQYIAEGITYISEALKLSEAMAAVTLIALANGAGDVITAIVASGSDGGVSYNIGALYGAGFFVCSVVIALTILNAPKDKPIVVDKNTIYRDIGFYILSSIVTIIFAVVGKIYWYSAVIFLAIYLAMVMVVYIQQRMEQKKLEEEEEEEEKLKLEQQQQQQDNKTSLLSKFKKAANQVIHQNKVINCMRSRNIKRKTLRKLTSMKIKEEKSQKSHTSHDRQSEQEIQPVRVTKSINDIESDLLPNHEQKGLIHISETNAQYIHKTKEIETSIKSIEEEEEDEDIPFADRTVLGKIGFIIDQPFDWTRKLTMPPCQQENYDKILCILWPFPGIIFILWSINMLGFNYYLLGGLILAFILSYVFYLTQKDLKQGETPKYFFAIAVISTILGLLWTYVLSQMLIDLLNVFVIIFKLSNTFMGLTILGIGNALPDALTTIALAGKGYAQMGITGSYAGQLFGLLVGFGLAQLKQTLMDGPQSFNLFEDIKDNLLDIIVIVICLVSLILTAVYALKNQLKYGKGLAIMLLISYGVFFVSAVGVQIWYLIDNISA